jgi:outer membrane beta-barrel protein
MTPLTPSLSKGPLTLSLSKGLLAWAILAALLAPRPASAQSKSDVFAGKIPPVSAALFRKAGRFEVSLTGNLSVNDPFFSKYFGGVKLGYHFTESLSLNAQVAAGTAARAGSAVVCPSNGGCQEAVDQQLFQVPGNLKLVTGIEGAWAPIYGKLNVFGERVAHFDLSLLAGADWISYEKVVSSAEAEELAAAGSRPNTASTIGGHVGLGARVFFTPWIAARLEFKDYIYQVPVPNWQEGGGARKDLQNQLFTELGVSIFFPFHNRPVQ